MELKKRLKFLVLFYPNRSPSQVFRLEAFLKYLPKSLYDYDWIINKEDEYAFYYGGVLKKIVFFIKISFRRFFPLFKGNFSNVIINREAYPPGTIFFEMFIKRILHKKIIYDFDDAIWLPVISEANKKYAFFKSYRKFSQIISISDVIIAGNSFLAEYARQFNNNVHIIPSCIDLDLYNLIDYTEKPGGCVCIGWSGSETTLPHLLILKDVMCTLQKKYGDRLYFKVISNRSDFTVPGVNIKSVKWSKEKEVSELKEVDIGIMPLPNNEWSLGKCSMKGIQYMGLGIPAVLSDIGMNKEVIESGINGLLAKNNIEWEAHLNLLIGDAQLRKKLGTAGRKTVEAGYSIQVWKDKWLNLVAS